MAEPTATVVVARTERAGRHDEAERWLDDLLAEARRAPGYLGGEIQPPGLEHPDEWVVVYEFESGAALTAWLGSDGRAAFRASEQTCFDGPAREQIIATAAQSRTVTGVSSFPLRQATDPIEAQRVSVDFHRAYDQLVGVLRRFDGFLSCELFEPEPGAQDDAIVVFSFASRRQLDRWLESPERVEALGRMRALLDAQPTVNVVGGFAGWFSPAPDRPTPVWKQATLVLAALYPVALVIGMIRDAVAPDLPGPLATFIGNAGGVVILSWFVMPPLTRRFRGWLSR